MATDQASGDASLRARILDACRWIEAGALEGNARAIEERSKER